MNLVVLCGRLTADPEIRYTNGENQIAVANYTLAVDRRGKDAGTDFIRCVAFRNNAEFAEKYLKKGTKIIIEGRIQTGSYEKDGHKVYTTDVIIQSQEFAESKKMAAEGNEEVEIPLDKVAEMFNIPESVSEEVPFL